MKYNKKLIPFLLSLFTIIIIIIIMCGCTLNSNSKNAEKIKNKALDYLNANYDDTFTALGYSDGDWAYDYSTVNFTSKKHSKSVEVRVYEENGTYTFTDDYFKLYMENDAVVYLNDIVSRYRKNTEIKVRFISPELPDLLNNKSTFFDYLLSEKCNLQVYLISNSVFNESDITAILSDICNAKIMGIFTFTVTNDEDLLSIYSISEIVNEKADSIIEKKSYTINNHFEITEQEVRGMFN